MKTCIDQRRIPGITRLYADYLYAFERVQPFFPAGNQYAANVSSRGDYPQDRRSAIADILDDQNRRFGSGEKTSELIALFGREGAVAVVAGQQVGLFGGPLLTLYKATTAIRIASELRNSGVDAVPIFWLASQDHDVAEIDHVFALDQASKPVRVEAHVRSRHPDAPVGRIAFGDEIAAALADFAQASGRSYESLGSIGECYQPGETFATAFARLFATWFRNYGLILFDPLDPRCSRLVPDLLADVFERQRELARALEDRSQQLLASGYHVQVHQGAGSTMLFMERNGSREGLRVDGEQLHVGDHQVSRKEIIRELKERPELFSPSALLRPVVQDTLLPTAVHVTGPAETAYLAQSGAIYELLQRPRPVVRPRVSATILDARARRLLEKYGISVEDLWKENTEELLARRSLPADLESSVTALQRRVEADFATLASRIAQLDPTLVDATTTAGNKIRHQFEQLQGRVERSFARHSQDLQRHAAHLSGSLYPNHLLQERVLSAAEWHLKYPDTFLPTIVEKLSVDCPDHQLIAL